MTDNENNASSNETTEIIPVESKINAAQFKGISSFEDAMALVEDAFGGELYSAEDLGDGFALMESKEKSQLVGVSFIILSANFSKSDILNEETGEAQEFCTMRVVTKDGRKLIVNDGSSGISEQIRTMWNMVPQSKGKPIFCALGLRVSVYNHPKHGPSKTFYLNTSSAK